MLKFNEYLDNELADDDFLLEIEEDLEEDAITLEDLIEWAEQLTEDQITEDLLDEKETQAAYVGRMKKLGRLAKRKNKLASVKRKKKRSQLKRKTGAKIQKSALKKAQREVIPAAIMKASGAGGMLKRKKWKEMKKAIVNRKTIVHKRKVKRDEPARMKRARAAMANHKSSHKR
jgi:hypothetical protein